MKTTDGQEIKKGDLCYTKEGTQAVLRDFAIMSDKPKYMINLFYEGETFFGEFHQCYTVEQDVPYELEDEDRPIIVNSIYANPPTQKICKEIKDKNIEIQDKRNELSQLDKESKDSLGRLNKIKKLCVNMYKNIEGMKEDYSKSREDYNRVSNKIESSRDKLYSLNNDIDEKEDYYKRLCQAVLSYKMGNKDLDKIPESSEIVHLREEVAILDALRAGGVDNWEWYDESLKNMEE